jgi:hypothetical protein
MITPWPIPPLSMTLGEQLADPEAHAQRVDAFVVWLQGCAPPGLRPFKTLSEWSSIVWYVEQIMRGNRDPSYYGSSLTYEQIAAFVESEGWPALFSALSRAMREKSGL